MKRTVEALVMMELFAAIAALAIAGLCGVARAEPVQQATPVVKLDGRAWLTRLSRTSDSVATPARFHVAAAFSTNTPGAELLTLQRAVVYFPDHAGTDGHLFPSCGARQIERVRGNVARCPEGSRIGGGTVKAQALQLGVTANGRVNLFNSGRGKDITFNFRTSNPAYINESLDAPLTQLHGIYGEKLTLEVPHPLQEILTGVFVGVQRFDVTIGGAVVVDGVRHSFLRARSCPTRALHGVFDFKDWTTGQTTTVTADAKVRCSVR